MLPSDDHSAGPVDSMPDVQQIGPSMPLGRRAFIAGTVGAVAATAIHSSAQAAVPSGASYYEPIDPVRLADTRTYAPYTNESKNFQRINDRLIRLQIIGGPYTQTVPSDAVAVVVSIAAIFNGPVAHPRGWVKAVPEGTTTEVSNINMESGDSAVANLATVRISNGKIDVQGQFPYDVVVDILGVYRRTTVARRSGRLEFLPATKRALTFTRMTAKSWRTVQLSFVPTHAQAVVVNLTVDQTRTSGFLTALGERTVGSPKVSNLNHGVNETRAAGAIVKLGETNGVASIEIYSHGDSNAIVDVTGYITGPEDPFSKEDGLFVPINPTRIMDTRRAADFARTNKKRLWPGWTRAFELPDGSGGFGQRSQMKGVAMNATLVTAMKLGFVTVLPAQTARNEVSNLNAARPGHIVANHVISEASSRGVEMFAHCGGDVIADIAGWYVGPPRPAVNNNPTLDGAVPKAPFNWVLNVPRMGLLNSVIPAPNGDGVVDSGNSWHWTGTGQLGEDNKAIVVFGHRTSARGPYRNQHLLVAGDQLFLDTPDGRRYEYKFVREQLTNDLQETILNTSRTNAATPSFTLVACTGSSTIFDDQPRGGIRYRIISTFALVRWTDTRPNEG